MLQDVISFPAPPRSGGTSEEPFVPGFRELRDRSRRAADAGRLDEALQLCDQAYDLAVASGETEVVDLAFCNRATVLLVLGRESEIVSGLREISMRGATRRSGFLAAYHLSRSYELRKSYKKGLFYGQLAWDRATALGDEQRQAQSANQIGNCLLGDSYFAEAREQYGQALELYGDAEAGSGRALVLDNLGYCLMMEERIDEGMALSLAALRALRRLGAYAYVPWPHVSLAYGYLELARLERAERHARRSLELAGEVSDPAVAKSALFLLGEIARTAGEADLAYSWFCELQDRFYPDSPRIAELMVSVSMRRVVNLRA